MVRRRPFLFLLSVLTLCATADAWAQNTPTAEGKALFEGLCVGCHGVNGTGDEGPALNRPSLTFATDEAALRRIIRDGIAGTGMPRVRRMTDDEVVALASYVRSLGRGAPVTVTGNAVRGRAVYQRLDCAACHVIDGQGGVLGPELTKIGERRAPNYLKQAVLEPGSVLSKGVLGILLNGFTEYLPVSVVEKNGREVRGLRVNEDSFTIQVRDADGKFYSFRKGEVEHVDKQFGRSLMPSYKDKLNTSETDDLVAYLYNLGGPK